MIRYHIEKHEGMWQVFSDIFGILAFKKIASIISLFCK
jgi:hypothetical protein